MVNYSAPLSNTKFRPVDALKYGLLSQNIDPIHLSKFTAKIMGHPKNILHGMFVSAYVIEKINLYMKKNIKIKFIRPLYLPASTKIYEIDGKLHITDGEKNSPNLILSAQ